MLFGVAMMAEFWLESIPQQLVSPDSLTARLRAASRRHNLLVIVGCNLLNAGTISALGILTLLTAFWPRLLADLAVEVGAIVTTTVVIFVAIKITEVINHVMLNVEKVLEEKREKRSPGSREFYVKAKKNLWQQALALCIVGWTVIFIIAVRHLTQDERSTPIITWTVQVLAGVTSAIEFMVLHRLHRTTTGVAVRQTLSRPDRLKKTAGHAATFEAVLDILHVKRMPTWKLHSSRALERGHKSNVGSHPHRHHKQERETRQDQEEKGVAQEVGGDRDEENIVALKIEYESVADQNSCSKPGAACAKTNTARIPPTIGMTSSKNEKGEVWEMAVETLED